MSKSPNLLVSTLPLLLMETGCGPDYQLVKQVDIPKEVEEASAYARDALDACTSLSTNANPTWLRTEFPSREGETFLHNRNSVFLEDIVEAGKASSGDQNLTYDKIWEGQVPLALRVSQQISGENCSQEDESRSCSSYTRMQFAFNNDFSRDVFGCELIELTSFEDSTNFFPFEVAAGFYTNLPSEPASTFASSSYFTKQDDVWIATDSFYQPENTYNIAAIFALEGGVALRFDEYKYDISNPNNTIADFAADVKEIASGLIPNGPSSNIQVSTIEAFN